MTEITFKENVCFRNSINMSSLRTLKNIDGKVVSQSDVYHVHSMEH